MLKNSFKNFLKRIKLLPFAKKIKRIFFVKKHPLQNFKNAKFENIIFLGSKYGGWSFVHEDNLKNCTIISAGLGEDASFDVEFASRYNAKIIIVDPTPRAIKHYDEMIDSLGHQSKTEYLGGGKQPINSYNLLNLKKENFTLIKKALWNKNEKLRFFSPNNPEYVSHSIINFQNQYKKNTNSIEVNSITIDELLDQLKLNKDDIPLIKLDIEGAEIEVLTDCFNKGFKPRQILVEFDELNFPSARSYERVTYINQILINNNYELVKTDGQADFLYLKS